MIRERVLTISTLLALMALSGVAHAEPTLKRKGSRGWYFEPDQADRPAWYRARAMQEGAPPAQIVREGVSRQTGCRYLYSGGPEKVSRHMLTLTRSGMGLIRMASRSLQSPRHVTKHSIEEHHDTSNLPAPLQESHRAKPARRAAVRFRAAGDSGSCLWQWRSSPGPPSTGAGWSPSASPRSFSRSFRAPPCAPCTFARAKARWRLHRRRSAGVRSHAVTWGWPISAA